MKNNLIALAVAISATTNQAFPAEILKQQGTDWDYLLYRTAINNAIDPANADANFHTTWFDPDTLGYDGPPFLTAPGYFGYGAITGAPITTNIWNPDGSLATNEPPSGQRYTAYFRTTVTPTQPVTFLRFSGIVDDGAIIYVNGAEFARVNMDPVAPDTWTLLSAAGGSETTPVVAGGQINLSAGVPVTIAVSVHSTSATSSDLGFDFEIESGEPVAPGNDDFADAFELLGDVPVITFGENDNGVGGLGATKEAGEPDHAGNAGGGSVWWKWTPSTSARAALSADGSSFNTLLAVYTGSSVDALTPVSRYPNLSVPASSADEPFWPGSRVEFNFEAETTYYIAVDGADGEFGTISLTLDVLFNPLDPIEELVTARSSWEYLLYTNPANQPVDPETVDPDFDTTWHTAALYGGPAFSGPAPALFGYGTINGDPIATNIWGGRDHDGDLVPDTAPPSGQRYTSYFRTTFTPTALVENLAFEGLIDDGAIIYLDGVEVARINVDPAKDATAWLTTADSANHDPGNVSNENERQFAFALEEDLPAGVEVELAVSVHNASATSSDMGFDLRVWSVNPPLEPPVPTAFNVLVALTGNPGELQLQWNNVPGATYHIDFSTDLENWFTLIPNIPADPSGTNTEFDFSLDFDPTGFFRVVQE